MSERGSVAKDVQAWLGREEIEVFKIIYSQFTCSQFIRFVKVSDSDSFALCSCRLPIYFTHTYEQVGNLKTFAIRSLSNSNKKSPIHKMLQAITLDLELLGLLMDYD